MTQQNLLWDCDRGQKNQCEAYIKTTPKEDGYAGN